MSHINVKVSLKMDLMLSSSHSQEGHHAVLVGTGYPRIRVAPRRDPRESFPIS